MSYSQRKLLGSVVPTEVDSYATSEEVIVNEAVVSAGSTYTYLDIGSVLALHRGPMFSPQPLGYVADVNGEITYGALSFNQPLTHGYWNIFASGPAVTVAEGTFGTVGHPTDQYDGIQVFTRNVLFVEAQISTAAVGPTTITMLSMDLQFTVDSIASTDITLRPWLFSQYSSFGYNPAGDITAAQAYIWGFNPIQYSMPLREVGMFNISTADLYSFEYWSSYRKLHGLYENIGENLGSNGTLPRYASTAVTPNADLMSIAMKTKFNSTAVDNFDTFSNPVIQHMDIIHVEPCLITGA